VDGIKHDFKTRQFTDLGNYRGFLTRQIVAEAKEKVAEGKEKVAEDEKDKPADKKDEGQAPAPGQILSRTAIKLQVK
jgi:sRNA-binding protein